MVSADDECVAVRIGQVLCHRGSLVNIISTIIKPSQLPLSNGDSRYHLHTPVSGVRDCLVVESSQEAGTNECVR